MLDLAIANTPDGKGRTFILTNHGRSFCAQKWPRDSESQIVTFAPSGKMCEVITAKEIAIDIKKAIELLAKTRALRGKKPDWYQRLQRYARGTEES